MLGLPLHEVLFFHFCKWLSGDLDSGTEETVILAAENAILALNEAPWLSKKGESRPNTWANLLFPAVLWALDRKSSLSSEAVFFRGIESVFDELLPKSHYIHRTDLSKLLSKLGPLFEKAPPEILGQALQHGVKSLKPSVNAFCRLIMAFSKLFKQS